MKLNWNFQRGWGGDLRKNPLRGGGMDIFWRLHNLEQEFPKNIPIATSKAESSTAFFSYIYSQYNCILYSFPHIYLWV